MRMDRYFAMLGLIDSLSTSSEITVATATVKCEIRGRCSPYVSHRDINFEEIEITGHEGKICDLIYFENGRGRLAFSLMNGSADGMVFEPFPYSIFAQLFASVPWGPRNIWEKMADIVWVRVDEIRTKRERSASRVEGEEAAKIAAIPD